MSDRSGP